MVRLVVFGHRPHRLFPGSLNPYGEREMGLLTSFCRQALERISQAVAVETVLTGMALGVDQAAAEAAVGLGYPVEAYLPFRGMESRWPARAQERFRRLLEQCRQVHVVGRGGYSPVLLYRRNEVMISQATAAAVLWDGRPGGGTWHGVDLLRRLRMPYWNFWAEWLEHWGRCLRGAQPETVTNLPPLQNF